MRIKRTGICVCVTWHCHFPSCLTPSPSCREWLPPPKRFRFFHPNWKDSYSRLPHFFIQIPCHRCCWSHGALKSGDLVPNGRYVAGMRLEELNTDSAGLVLPELRPSEAATPVEFRRRRSETSIIAVPFSPYPYR
jgi:hypothetical protein